MTDNSEDEIIDIRLPRSEYKILREMIRREETYSYLGKKLSSLWVWAVAGGILTVLALWDSIQTFVGNIK